MNMRNFDIACLNISSTVPLTSPPSICTTLKLFNNADKAHASGSVLSP